MAKRDLGCFGGKLGNDKRILREQEINKIPKMTRLFFSLTRQNFSA